MKLTLTASTGTDIVVWRDGEMFHARRAGELGETQVCLGVDLFEVIAELADLDLEQTTEADEAVRLADTARERLADTNHGLADDGPSSEEDWQRSP